MSSQPLHDSTSTLLESLQREVGEAFVNRGNAADIVRLSDVDARHIEWLWDRWIPARMLTILGGDRGDGKSTVIASLIGAWTTGGELPDGSRAKKTNVLMLSAEEDPSFAVRPRLDQHGADVRRVFALKGTSIGNGRTRWFDLKWDIKVMREVIRKRRIGLVVIDPLSSYLPKRIRNREADIREALQPLIDLSADTGVGVVGIMHVGKSGEGRRPSQRLLGSTAFTALARSVLMIADQPDDLQPADIATGGTLKVLQVVKSNYSIPPAPQVFRRPLDAPIAWLGDSDVSIEECFSTPPAHEHRRDAAERNGAVVFLTGLLADGPVPSSEVLTQARAHGFSERTLRRAKKTLGILALRDGALGAWKWQLPTPPDQPPA